MTALTVGELCAGYGGLGMAVEEVFGARLAWVSEYDAAPSRILAHHWPHVPNLGDMTKIDWSAVPYVDIISGGTPCQDLSHAGRRKGMSEGTRSNLWVQMREAIAAIRPRFVVWENVRGAFSAAADSDVEPCPGCVGDGSGVCLRALGRVLGDLSDLGYDAAWHGLTAASIGATHGRYRVFVFAWDTRTATDARGEHRIERRQPAPSETSGRGTLDQSAGRRGARDAADPESVGWAAGDVAVGDAPQRSVADGDQGAAADTVGGGRDGRAPVEVGGPQRRTAAAGGSADTAADAASLRRGEGRPEPGGQLGRPDAAVGGAPTDWGVYGPAVARWGAVLGRPAPSPTEANWERWHERRALWLARRRTSRLPVGRRGHISADLLSGPAYRLSPRFVEWMMGLPAGHVTDVPGVSRNDQLKALGNGVVPQQAAAALRFLMDSTDSVRNSR